MRNDEWECVLDLLEAAFGERSVFDRYMKHDPDLGPDDTLLALERDRPVSCVQIFTKRVRLLDDVVTVGGIGSVGTHPDHRARGLASALLRRAIDEMQRRGMTLSLLFTGRHAFYGRLGWVGVPQTRLAFRARAGTERNGAGLRPFDPADLPALEQIYELYARTLATATVRDRAYWEGQLRYAGAPDEELRVAEREGRLVAYARRVEVEGVPVVMEYGREADAASELADLLGTLAPEGSALILPFGGDRDLRDALAGRALRLDPFADPSLMWRVLDRGRLAKLADLSPQAGDGPLLQALVGGDRALYWPSDRF